MSRKRRSINKPTVGQKVWFCIYRAEEYDKEAAKVFVPDNAAKSDPERWTRSWLEGMSRNLKSKFPSRLRESREKLGVTQEAIATIADFSTNAVAMIERGERVPSLDSAARLCWALDIASRATAEEIGL